MSPRFARLLLSLCAPPPYKDVLLGDLEEEYAVEQLPRLGFSAARRWYRQQVLRSLLPLLSLRWRQGELPLVLLYTLAGLAIPLQSLDLLWSFALSQVPLRADATRTTEMLAVSLLYVALASFISGHRLASAFNHRNSAWLLALCGVAAALLTSTRSAPPPCWYLGALTSLVPFACLLGAALGRRPISHSGAAR